VLLLKLILLMAMAINPILYPWQQRWVKDQARLKIAVKSTQIGFSFVESYDDVVDSLEREHNLWCILSRSERQALEFARKCKEHCNAIGAVAQLLENESFEGTSMKQHIIEFPNLSRIIVLTSNPDTARGYTGNVVLDEFAFHKDSKAVFTAAYGRATLGFKLRVISTPFGESGKFYELAKLADLVSGRPPQKKHDVWSGHWCDIHLAAKEGLRDAFGRPIDVEALLAGVEDEDIRKQEYLCVFLSGATAWIPWELIVQAQSSEGEVVTISRDKSETEALKMVAEAIERMAVAGDAEVTYGGDVARRRDLTVNTILWHFKALNMVHVPLIVRIHAQPFRVQRQIAEMLIERCGVRRGCQDSTGMGMQLAEELQQKFGASRIEAVDFTGPVKEDLAVTAKRPFEDHAIRIPDNSYVAGGIHAVRRYTTAAGNFRFDAERTEAGHADEFWSLALALAAASGAPAVALQSVDAPEDSHRSERKRILTSQVATQERTTGGWSVPCPECGEIVPAFFEDDAGEPRRIRDCKHCDAPLPPVEAPALEEAARVPSRFGIGSGRDARGMLGRR